MMKSQEKQKIIDQSLVACHVNAEAPRDRGEVKLYELSQVQVLELVITGIANKRGDKGFSMKRFCHPFHSKKL